MKWCAQFTFSGPDCAPVKVDMLEDLAADTVMSIGESSDSWLLFSPCLLSAFSITVVDLRVGEEGIQRSTEEEGRSAKASWVWDRPVSSVMYDEKPPVLDTAPGVGLRLGVLDLETSLVCSKVLELIFTPSLSSSPKDVPIDLGLSCDMLGCGRCILHA
jgi:hypothetical protein